MPHALSACVLILALAALPAHAGLAVEPFVGYAHMSDVFRGPPLNNREEPTADALGAGATITLGKRGRFEVDIAHGVKRFGAGTPWESGTYIAARYYPRR